MSYFEDNLPSGVPRSCIEGIDLSELQYDRLLQVLLKAPDTATPIAVTMTCFLERDDNFIEEHTTVQRVHGPQEYWQ